MTLYAEPEHKPLDIITDKDFNFVSHRKLIIITVNKKISVLNRIALFMTDFAKKS